MTGKFLAHRRWFSPADALQDLVLSNLKITRFGGAQNCRHSFTDSHFQDAEDALQTFNGKPFMGTK
jgi:hypothetical protein